MSLKNRCLTLQAFELASFFAWVVVQVTDFQRFLMGVSGEGDCAAGAPLAMLVGLLQSSPRSRQERHKKRKTINNTMR
ncbi:hypothetical protein ACGTNG_09900 [Halomonas sp. 1390]|uniref:hypothetical protein n=1 Tax=Halomonas sp. B23F22_3 TaxID=3459516 RepID=UPI00373F6FD9